MDGFQSSVVKPNQTNYLPIRRPSQSQTVVKPKTKPSGCLITFDTQLTTALLLACLYKFLDIF